MCTLSLDWNSRDFLLAKTCRWLETWQKTGWRERKERGGGRDYRRKGEFIQWTPTLMLLWYSRTLLRAKTWMWLDTYGAVVTPMRKKKKMTHIPRMIEQYEWSLEQGERKHYHTEHALQSREATKLTKMKAACSEPGGFTKVSAFTSAMLTHTHTHLLESLQSLWHF